MKTVEVVAAIITSRKTVLATQRGYGEFKGKWEFPGGKIEKGEVPKTALFREILEELCLEVQVHQHIITVEHQYDSFHLTMHCYLCTILKNDFTLTEHSDAKWLSAEKLYEVDWLPADIPVIKAILEQKLLE